MPINAMFATNIALISAGVKKAKKEKKVLYRENPVTKKIISCKTSMAAAAKNNFRGNGKGFFCDPEREVELEKEMWGGLADEEGSTRPLRTCLEAFSFFFLFVLFFPFRIKYSLFNEMVY